MDFWVVVAEEHGTVKPVTRELCARAAELAGAAGGKVSALVLSDRGEEINQQLAGLGVAQAICVNSPELRRYRTRPWVDAAAAAVRAHSPKVVLVPATTNGR
ncbi:MAG: hypothetical protein KC591_06380, partial [Gemmatimonadetes bacterium]|nr:hypothetical protein [Gemmatimonadota bacterium]